MKSDEYSKYIQDMMDRVKKGEVVFPKEKEDNPLYKKMKTSGIKNVLIELFNESEVPRFLAEEDTEEGIEGSLYKFVNTPSSYKDADTYWNQLVSKFRNLGIIKNESGGKIDTTVLANNQKDEVLRICLLRDESNGDKPTIGFIYINGPVVTPVELNTFMSKVGLRVDRTTAKSVGNWIVADILDS
jgi:hypothetical protein